LGKYSTNPYKLYYASIDLKNTSFERQINRLQHDPIRFYDGNNEEISIKTIKAVTPR
jgi:hypothetical protein